MAGDSKLGALNFKIPRTGKADPKTHVRYQYINAT